MEWTEVIREAVDYVERHITEDITVNDVAGQGRSVCRPFIFTRDSVCCAGIR